MSHTDTLLRILGERGFVGLLSKEAYTGRGIEWSEGVLFAGRLTARLDEAAKMKRIKRKQEGKYKRFWLAEYAPEDAKLMYPELWEKNNQTQIFN